MQRLQNKKEGSSLHLRISKSVTPHSPNGLHIRWVSIHVYIWYINVRYAVFLKCSPSNQQMRLWSNSGPLGHLLFMYNFQTTRIQTIVKRQWEITDVATPHWTLNSVKTSLKLLVRFAICLFRSIYMSFFVGIYFEGLTRFRSDLNLFLIRASSTPFILELIKCKLGERCSDAYICICWFLAFDQHGQTPLVWRRHKGKGNLR